MENINEFKEMVLSVIQANLYGLRSAVDFTKHQEPTDDYIWGMRDGKVAGLNTGIMLFEMLQKIVNGVKVDE